jgi:hypothetical protein
MNYSLLPITACNQYYLAADATLNTAPTRKPLEPMNNKLQK